MKAEDLKKTLEHVPDNAEVWFELPYPQRVHRKDEIDNEHLIITARSAGYSDVKGRLVIWHSY